MSGKYLALLPIALCLSAQAATRETVSQAVYRGSSVVERPATIEGCRARAAELEDRDGPIATYKCAVSYTYTRTSTPTPVNCAVSAWSAWSQCTSGQQTRSRTITTQPANGGTACPALTETQACSSVEPVPGANMAIVCDVTVVAGTPPESCAWTSQTFRPVTSDSFVRACLASPCSYEQLRWQRFGEITANGWVDVCRVAKQPGDPVVGGGCGASGWESMGQVRPAEVIQAVVTPTSSARLTWTTPTANTDGSTPANVASYIVHYGRTCEARSQALAAAASPASVTGLEAGSWCFSVSAVNSEGSLSAPSNTVAKSF